MPAVLLSGEADDLGSNEMGFMNSTRGIHTPNLDALAFSGVTLRNCESALSLYLTSSSRRRSADDGSFVASLSD
jgi:hypothetical protein